MGTAEFVRPSRANKCAPTGAGSHKASVIFMSRGGETRHDRLT